MKRRGLVHIAIVAFLVTFLVSYGLTVALTGAASSLRLDVIVRP